MARKYKFHDNSKLYFVTFTVVNWIDAFIREENRTIFYESVKYCQENKGLEVYGYCIMTSHIHMIIGTENDNLSDIVRDLNRTGVPEFYFPKLVVGLAKRSYDL